MDREIIFDIDKSKGIECYVDEDFAGGWSHVDSEDVDNIMLCTGFVIM